MVSRRMLIVGGAAAAAAAAGIHHAALRPSYGAAAEALWTHRALPPTPDLLFLAHYATLAANSHNTQPWRFRGDAAAGPLRAVVIEPDFSRATPVADPDCHHLFASLGCAAENLALAAGAAGRAAQPHFVADGRGHVRVELAAAGGHPDPLFTAIPARQCTRSDYEGGSVAPDALARLEGAARVEGCGVLLITDRAETGRVLELILAANTAQVGDPAFVQELRSWVRFNSADALRHGDGLYSACSGNPSLPGWLGELVFSRVFTPEAENDRYARQIRSSAGLAVFVEDRDDPAHWVQAGRSYQRFALAAAELGLRHAFVNQAVEVAETRVQLSRLLGLREGQRPGLIVRFGHAPPMPRSLRRPLDQVITT